MNWFSPPHLIEIILLIGIAYAQWIFFRQGRAHIRTLSRIFHQAQYSLYTTESGPTLIHNPQSGPIFQGILSSFNLYLSRNRGAAADFNLLKDIVERNCQEVEDEAEAFLPIPIYLGLAGTMVGIICGLAGVSDFSDAELFAQPIIMGVAIAMLVSLAGIIGTTWLSFLLKNARRRLQHDKNEFYSWTQTNILPNIVTGLESAITQLHQNLAKFNEDLARNVVRMEQAMENIAESYDRQAAVFDSLSRLDIAGMATANLRVMERFDLSMAQLHKFDNYFTEVNRYLGNVATLSDKLDYHLARTETLVKFGEFFEREIHAIDERKQVLNQNLLDIDTHLRQHLDNLKASVNTLDQNWSEHLITQREQFRTALNDQSAQFAHQIQSEQQQLLDTLTRDAREAADLRALPDLRKGVDEIARALSLLTARLDTFNAPATTGTVSTGRDEGMTGKSDSEILHVLRQQRRQLARMATQQTILVVILAFLFFGAAICAALFLDHFNLVRGTLLPIQ